MNEYDRPRTGQKRHNTTLWIFIAIILYFLITEHWAHIVPVLPWLLLAACPLMHLFMHRGHGHHGGHDHQPSSEQDASSNRDRNQGGH